MALHHANCEVAVSAAHQAGVMEVKVQGVGSARGVAPSGLYHPMPKPSPSARAVKRLSPSLNAGIRAAGHVQGLLCNEAARRRSWTPGGVCMQTEKHNAVLHSEGKPYR